MATSQCPSEAELASIAERGQAEGLPPSLRIHVESCDRCKGWLEDAHRNDEFAVTLREAVRGESSTCLMSSDTLTAERRVSSAGLTGGIPGYEIVREIHHGGQGIVYEGVQLSTKQRVAIKVLKEGPFASPAERVRFEREVEILGQLKHPGIVAIHDSGVAGGQTFLVMDYIEGRTLDQYATDEKPSVSAIVELFRSICEAVNAAHVRGVIHRDLKPNNIIVDNDGRPQVLDFGLAKTHADDRTAR